MLLWSTAWNEARSYLHYGVGEFELWLPLAVLSCGIVFNLGRLRRIVEASPRWRPAVRSPGAQAVRRSRRGCGDRPIWR
jgi:hypothetical protein